MLLATVSQAPYCRGGVRQAMGERIANLLSALDMLLNARGKVKLQHRREPVATRRRKVAKSYELGMEFGLGVGSGLALGAGEAVGAGDGTGVGEVVGIVSAG